MAPVAKTLRRAPWSTATPRADARAASRDLCPAVARQAPSMAVPVKPFIFAQCAWAERKRPTARHPGPQPLCAPARGIIADAAIF